MNKDLARLVWLYPDGSEKSSIPNVYFIRENLETFLPQSDTTATKSSPTHMVRKQMSMPPSESCRDNMRSMTTFPIIWKSWMNSAIPVAPTGPTVQADSNGQMAI